MLPSPRGDEQRRRRERLVPVNRASERRAVEIARRADDAALGMIPIACWRRIPPMPVGHARRAAKGDSETSLVAPRKRRDRIRYRSKTEEYEGERQNAEEDRAR
jgi:hypothetical protein